MFENLKGLDEQFKTLEMSLADPVLLSDMDKWQVVNREYHELKPVVEAYRLYSQTVETIEEDKFLLGETDDEEMREMLKEEISSLEKALPGQAEELKILLLPKDPNDHKNVFIEIRGGAGGDEAALFAGDLYRMYLMFADKSGYKTEVMSYSDQGIGGVKEAVIRVTGQGAYSILKYESGVHRVQRVPETESSGRIHTSTATVAVLPEAEDVDVEIDPNDLRIDVYRSSGNGGQSVNTTDSAVRITHLPTGVVVSCQDEKSQIKNKDKAMKVLRSRLYDMKMEEQQKEISDDRRSQVGTGDRSERIRTYNFPQGRVTDHRINKTVHQLQNFLDGDIREMIDALITADQAAKMEKAAEFEQVGA